jgi:hypothetical protein
VFEELQKLLLRTKLKHSEIIARTGLSRSLLRGIKLGEKDNPTIETYAALKQCLEEAEGKKPVRKAA